MNDPLIIAIAHIYSMYADPQRQGYEEHMAKLLSEVGWITMYRICWVVGCMHACMHACSCCCIFLLYAYVAAYQQLTCYIHLC